MKKIFLFVLFLFPVWLFSQLKINEIMTNNVSAVMDNAYNYSMWVELYNPTSESHYHNTFYFTDDLKEPTKWKPSGRTLIQPGEYLVLWFERPGIYGHATFKLNPEGGNLYLLNEQGKLVDQVTYPAQFRNVSYGRKTDGADEWVFFSEYSPGESNHAKKYSNIKGNKPVFGLPGGFYNTTLQVTITSPSSSDVIYYTLDGSEPTVHSGKYSAGRPVSITRTTCIRAIAVSEDKLPGEIASATYFINEREFNLPVVSIITAQANLTDDMTGIYVSGKNGITGNCENTRVNWNQNWSRPANFELFDKNRKACLNQELDITIAGGCSRSNPQKSLKISPRKKFGDNRLRYDIFPEVKPHRNYKDILFRNSGNDFFYSMMRDGFMQSLVVGRLDIDYQAYQPAICFINGVYYGIQNLRERTNKDYLFTNYGLDEEDFYLLENREIISNSEFAKVTTFVRQNNPADAAIYNQVKEWVDIDSYISYMIAEIYYGNTDWPHNNFKVWKKKENGKWRWILYDTDFGYNLFDADGHTHNTLTYVLHSAEEWSVYLFRRLMLNEEFKEKFIRKFCIHLSSTFETDRVNQVMDSIATAISTEIVYHKNKWVSYRSFNEDMGMMKSFSTNRPEKLFTFIGDYFFNSTMLHQIELSANISRPSYFFSSEEIRDSLITLKYFKDQGIRIEAKDIRGYAFTHWEYTGGGTTHEIFPMGSRWKYWDKYGIPAENWNEEEYDDTGWEENEAQFGYGNKGEKTIISYGDDPNNKYPTTYFRKKIILENIKEKENFLLTLFVDDGAVIYINGKEAGRYNLPDGEITFHTYANVYNNGDRVTFKIPEDLLKEGENLIAVEVHQVNATSSDLIFDLSFQYSSYNENTEILTNPVFETTLSENLRLKAIYEEAEIPIPEKTPAVYINEIVSGNNQYRDEYGDKSDYIELYNDEETEVDIAGWYLSDIPSNPVLSRIMFDFPEKTVIPPKGRIIIWADKQPYKGALHVDFSLSKAGETIVLSRENAMRELEEVDKVTFPALEKNMSYSRVPDGNENWVIQPPTFNLPNDYKTTLINDAQLDENESKIKIYPTLVKEYLIIENAHQEKVRVMDIAGKPVLQTICKSEYEEISLEFLPEGIYIIKVGQASTFKIIKIR